jgi:hypothetical protein
MHVFLVYTFCLLHSWQTAIFEISEMTPTETRTVTHARDH